MQSNNNHILWYKKLSQKQVYPHVIDSPVFPVTLKSRSPWLLGHCSCQLHKSCAGMNIVYSQAGCVFILCNIFASKQFAAVREAFSSVYPDNEVPNKTTCKKIQDTGNVCL
jgi:hypothetical protein